MKVFHRERSRADHLPMDTCAVRNLLNELGPWYLSGLDLLFCFHAFSR
jgi:hypothetical protein